MPIPLVGALPVRKRYFNTGGVRLPDILADGMSYHELAPQLVVNPRTTGTTQPGGARTNQLS